MKNNDYITSGIIKGEFKMSEYLKDSFSAQTELKWSWEDKEIYENSDRKWVGT